MIIEHYKGKIINNKAVLVMKGERGFKALRLDKNTLITWIKDKKKLNKKIIIDWM